MVTLTIFALFCAVFALELRHKAKQYRYTKRKEIDHLRAMRGF